MSIDKMSAYDAIARTREMGKRANESGDLNLILGSNGLCGRGATGNYTLLARATGLSRVHIGKVLQGRVEPSHKTLRKLCEVTGVSVGKMSAYLTKKKKERQEVAA